MTNNLIKSTEALTYFLDVIQEDLKEQCIHLAVIREQNESVLRLLDSIDKRLINISCNTNKGI
jgi:hypothetical protein